MTEHRYFEDPLCLAFSARVTETLPHPHGRTGAVLLETYFYPTGGGQEHDTGMIGEARVLDVFREDGGRIVHVLDRALPPGVYPASIDRERRLRNMQHHTAQHILSAAFEQALGWVTVSANINADNPSTIDLEAPEPSPGQLQQVEAFANRVILENRPVKSFFVAETETASVPFRRAPKVRGTIRVIEVETFDYSACGGTHCPRTGMVGPLVILRSERVNQKLRIHFTAGLQTLDVFRLYRRAAHQAASLLKASPDDLAGSLERLLADAEQAHAQLESLRRAGLDAEAGQLAGEAGAVAGVRLVTRLFPGRAPAELRLLGARLNRVDGLVAILAAYDGKKLSLVVACAPDTGLDARMLLTRHMDPFGGRGGGDASLAQGGGHVNEKSLAGIFSKTSGWLLSGS
ncbi:MAG: hypothetical protein JXB85_08875 [Anaerolineales bacterium]|nr:hypothetical protein [Anaerolineales bacterium]